MSKPKVKTIPDFSETSEAHIEAKKLGNDHFTLWQRNVVDKYKDMPTEDIKLDLQRTAFPFAVCVENLIGDFNMGTVIRNANGFNAKEVYYLGNKKFDRRSMVGVQNYTDIKFISTIDELVKPHDQYVFVGVDNVEGSVDVINYQFKPNTLFIFGEEGVGLSKPMQLLCDDIVSIPMFGSVRSFNCGVASGIVMYDYIRKFI